MMTLHTMHAVAPSDADLVQRCLTEGSGAFAQIVARYQTLVCSLAYNATGSLSRSEDLAQEVFVTAWKDLRQLREPAKLRPWLCGIARRMMANTLRREGREPVCAAEELLDEHHAPELDPAQQTISREEEAILWRSLEKIPETYREPLILFYREGQSVERVAQALEISEDAAKQRLSRGRKLLQEQVAEFVEVALGQSAPGRTFTLCVIASLPLMAGSATAATLGTTAAKSGAAAKGMGLLTVLSTLIGPVMGCFGAWVGIRAGLDNAQSERERQLMKRQVPLMMALVVGMIAGMVLLETQGSSLWDVHPLLPIFARLTWTLGLVSAIFAAGRWSSRKITRIRAEEAPNLSPEAAVRHARAWRTFEYKSPWTLLGLPLLHVCAGRALGEKIRPAVGWIAIGDKAVGVLFAFGGWAFGGVSLGVFSFGVMPLGAFSAGVLAAGVLAFGLWGGLGSAAVGYFAQGTDALAWHAAQGQQAVAHLFALGDHARALHVNDAAAHEAIGSQAFFRLSDLLAHHSGWMQLIWLPFLLIIWQARRARRALKGKSAGPV